MIEVLNVKDKELNNFCELSLNYDMSKRKKYIEKNAKTMEIK